jgi:hypothetical protein
LGDPLDVKQGEALQSQQKKWEFFGDISTRLNISADLQWHKKRGVINWELEPLKKGL